LAGFCARDRLATTAVGAGVPGASVDNDPARRELIGSGPRVGIDLVRIMVVGVGRFGADGSASAVPDVAAPLRSASVQVSG